MLRSIFIFYSIFFCGVYNMTGDLKYKSRERKFKNFEVGYNQKLLEYIKFNRTNLHMIIYREKNIHWPPL